MQTQTEIRLSTLLDEREANHKLHETVIQAVGNNEDKMPSESQAEQINIYREKAEQLDGEIEKLSADVEAHRKSVEASRAIRRVLAGNTDGVDADEDGIVYRDFATYARDVVITRTGQECSKIGMQVGTDLVAQAKERLDLMKRTPANTLSSNVLGLQPEQHISQIFQEIDNSRPLVASAFRTTLERGSFTFPQIVTRPVVAVQATQKTEAGNTGMVINMVTATASTYLGGGNLSWQAINWSTPDALSMWFRLCAADYALKTEQDAGEVIQTAAFINDISTLFPAASTGTMANLLTAIADGIAAVYSASGKLADTLYLAPDRAAYILGLTSSALPMFANASLSFSQQTGNIAGLNVVISRGLDAGVIAVGVASDLIVAETAGAPVELRVVEPAIGGVEVGLIGAFEAVVSQNTSFALLTAAS